MKFSTTLAVTLVTAGSFVAASPHLHRRHHHAEKRAADYITLYELDGQVIPEKDVIEGCKNGTLIMASGACPSAVASTAPPSTSSAAPTPTPSSSKTAAAFYQQPSSSSTTTSSVSSASSSAAAATPASSSGGSSGGKGLDKDFPDGSISCSTFPSDYGPISVDWMQLGGWSGIQSGSASSLSTVTAGGSCSEGNYCSYACPPGYQKSQWPTTQGSTGQSIGGLLCEGGKLKLTNSALSSKLCIPGTGNVQVQNTLSKNVAVCRTDYPGTESETVPLNAQPGSTTPLTCPNANTYYTWLGGSTSAQYYVNPSGVSPSEACIWGDSSKPYGNWAPINLGVGTKDGATWLSIMANKPTQPDMSALDFTVEIIGDNLSGTCKFQNGQFISLTGSNSDGCTVQVMSGTATYKFS